MEDYPKLPTSICAVREFSMQALPRCPIVSTLPNGVVVHDAQGAILMANPAAEEILGVSLSQMQGKTSLDPIWHCIHEDGSGLSGETHPGMVVLTTRQPMHGVIMGSSIRNRRVHLAGDQRRPHHLRQRPSRWFLYMLYDITIRVRQKLQINEGLLAMGCHS